MSSQLFTYIKPLIPKAMIFSSGIFLGLSHSDDLQLLYQHVTEYFNSPSDIPKQKDALYFLEELVQLK